tara:strand:+ start:1235 stop:1819 length:585 start_codon:yes stop_codon:yes gene_type:complete
MKRLILILLLPLFTFSQNDCGERPIKPNKINNQTNKEYKNSAEYLSYKKILKSWKHCVSPLGISEKLDAGLEKKLIKENEQPINPCGDKPLKPKREKNQSIDEYRKTPGHKTYREKLKEWKSCMSPIGNLKANKLTNDNNAIEGNPKVVSPCGNKPLKPVRDEGLNHEEYRQTAEHIVFRQKLKEWRSCMKNEK